MTDHVTPEMVTELQRLQSEYEDAKKRAKGNVWDRRWLETQEALLNALQNNAKALLNAATHAAPAVEGWQPTEQQLETVGYAIHEAFWKRQHARDPGIGTQVAKDTWPAAREARMIEARAALLGRLPLPPSVAPRCNRGTIRQEPFYMTAKPIEEVADLRHRIERAAREQTGSYVAVDARPSAWKALLTIATYATHATHAPAASPSPVHSAAPDVGRLIEVSERICQKLEHPTATVTWIDQEDLRAALDAIEAICALTQSPAPEAGNCRAQIEAPSAERDKERILYSGALAIERGRRQDAERLCGHWKAQAEKAEAVLQQAQMDETVCHHVLDSFGVPRERDGIELLLRERIEIDRAAIAAQAAELARCREALEKVAGRKEIDDADWREAVKYKREEGLWTVEEYLADAALTPSPASTGEEVR